MNGVAWSLVAALGFGFTQILNRKSNQLVGAFRTAFGLLIIAEIVLLGISIATGEIDRLVNAPRWALACFSVATLFHFGAGWTLLALSQQKVGVARTGAAVSVAPLIGTLAAALALNEPLTPLVILGVVVVVGGVALLSLSASDASQSRWVKPWHALTVAFLWGTSPLLIRVGLTGLDSPLLGLTVGIGTTVIIYGLGLFLRQRHLTPITARQRQQAIRWMVAGGITGAIAISAQWISFRLTTIAIALSVQQLAALVVVGMVPFVFREPFERLNLRLILGTLAILGGTTLVVLAPS